MRITIIVLVVISFLLCITSASETTFNFTFDDGDIPWQNHISSQVNMTYESALEKAHHLRKLVCVGDSTDDNKKPFGPITPICMEGRGAKMVVPVGYPRFANYIFISPAEGGLFEQKHMAERPPLHFYDEASRFMTKYFLVKFDDYEIPTSFPLETQQYLPLWKKLFLKRNQMSSEYFDNHIRVVATSIGQSTWDGKPDRRFCVHYYYYIDWAHIKLQDRICINQNYEAVERLITDLLPNEALHSPSLWSMRNELEIGLSIGRIASTAHLADKEEIIRVISEASRKLTFNVNKHLRLNSAGQFIIDVYGVENESENKCLRATVKLDDASITEVRGTPCYIY